MAVRNARVASGSLVGTVATAIYTVPSGNNFILKSVVLYNPNAASQTAQLGLFAGVAPVVWLPRITIPAGDAVNLALWTVLNAGDQLYLAPTASPNYYWVAGAVLPLSSP